MVVVGSGLDAIPAPAVGLVVVDMSTVGGRDSIGCPVAWGVVDGCVEVSVLVEDVGGTIGVVVSGARDECLHESSNRHSVIAANNRMTRMGPLGRRRNEWIRHASAYR